MGLLGMCGKHIHLLQHRVRDGLVLKWDGRVLEQEQAQVQILLGSLGK